MNAYSRVRCLGATDFNIPGVVRCGSGWWRITLNQGMIRVIEPGHDAWVTSSEPMVGFEFDSSAAQSYAKPS